MLSKMLQLALACVLILGEMLLQYLDWQGRADVLKEKHPTIWRAVNSRPMRLVVLVLIVGFLARDFRDSAATAPPPSLRTSPPPAPLIREAPKAPTIAPAVDRSGAIDRYLNSEEKDHLYQELKKIAAREKDKKYITVTIAAAHRFDRESARLALQLQNTFQDAGWNIAYQKTKDYENPQSPQFSGQFPIGIWVSSTNNMGVYISSVLVNVGLNADSVPEQMTLDPSFSGTLILVGYKAPP